MSAKSSSFAPGSCICIAKLLMTYKKRILLRTKHGSTYRYLLGLIALLEQEHATFDFRHVFLSA